MEKLHRGLCGVFDLFYLPPDLAECRGNYCLHVSDTPRCFYGSLGRLITLLEPPLVVHTGDLADDIKIGLRPGMIDLYASGLRRLARVLALCDGRVVLSLGNHDDEALAGRLLGQYDLLPGGDRVRFGSLALTVGHYAHDLAPQAGELALFGHDGTPDRTEGDTCWLNGQLHINLIDWRTGELRQLCYPRYVHDQRQMLGKWGQ